MKRVSIVPALLLLTLLTSGASASDDDYGVATGFLIAPKSSEVIRVDHYEYRRDRDGKRVPGDVRIQVCDAVNRKNCHALVAGREWLDDKDLVRADTRLGTIASFGGIAWLVSAAPSAIFAAGAAGSGTAVTVAGVALSPIALVVGVVGGLGYSGYYLVMKGIQTSEVERVMSIDDPRESNLFSVKVVGIPSTEAMLSKLLKKTETAQIASEPPPKKVELSGVNLPVPAF